MKKAACPRVLGGRSIALWIAAAGILSIAAAVAACRDLLLAEWYILELRSERPQVRVQAIERLGELRSRRAYPHLVDIAQEVPSLEMPALRALAAIGPVPAAGLSGYRERWSRQGRERLIDLLRQDGQTAAELAPLAAAALWDAEWAQQEWAIGILRWIDAPAIPALNELLRHPDAPVRRAAAQALYFMEARSAGSIPGLRGLLDAGDPIARFYAAETLAALGQTAEGPRRVTP